MCHTWAIQEIHIKHQSENRKGRDHLGNQRRRWKDDINMDILEIVCEGVDWIHLVLGPVTSCEDGKIPSLFHKKRGNS